ncbi:cytochrome-c oxidase, cbb3-type subunit I [uncultured Winogradskyella sp.]|uniref:cytochrome-c oxidase, cbb3-type subunit I n=1 Tax=uncultured Winogradskyella sp. TaxID=395353 RepID=UPI00260EE3A3|nr:cytochrome-c oxidase, cbb3-type subunit I [uncultured Winogradskyella sp.]|tara:strand:- start:3876 stop:6074 length:2199 start_codon:yes stop_codon:yes gene_type:complete
MEMQQFYYDNKIVKKFLYATIVFGVVGMLVGLLLAFMFLFPNMTDGISWLSFGRLRPLHTNAVIFAFVGNAIFAGVYYSTQRLLKARMFSDLLSNINFWGWQLIIVGAAITLPLGYSTSKEYAELEWPFDIAIALIWVAFGINLIGTMLKRRQRHLYVAIWFYIATFVTVAVLHIFNSLEIPVSFTGMKSYSVYAGVQDALVQWWYGHNAVAFFLTTPFLGLMYYFVPKAANRPVYSYRLSIVHFWSLIFIYIWAGPHHLLYTALPEWAQHLGVAFSVMLLMPSWGGMINGLLTLRGAWDKVRTDPVLKFMVVAITGYGMATFEGPMLSLKNVNAIAHFTDWIIAHVHVGALAWNGFLAFGMIYWLIPRLFKTKLFSIGLANVHFWIGTLGIMLYALPLYVAGFAQASMWKQFNPDGTLVYGNFLETVTEIMPMYWMRAIGGTLYLTGMLILVYNVIMTIAKSDHKVTDELAEAPALKRVSKSRVAGEGWHTWLERKPVLLTIYATIAILIGGVVQIIPTIVVKSNIPTISSVKPYTPLELEGRDLYIREGCVGCHSQMVRPFRSEVERYGEYSKAGEFVYDHPFLWGSKRTGPDLHRVGGKYSDNWHFNHMYDPQGISTGSIMPAYQWLIRNELDKSDTEKKMEVMVTLGVPYTEEDIANAQAAMLEQGTKIEKSLYNDPDFVASYEADKAASGEDFVEMRNREIVAMIAYLQRLGTDIKVKDIIDETVQN